jgi:HlyD family secretion protein
MWFFGFGIILLLALAWVATQSGPLAPIRVTETRVVEGDVHPALFGIGIVEAQRAYLIGPTVAGRVKRVLVDVGEKVKAGQLLAEMDPVDLDARLASEVAAIAHARSAESVARHEVNDAKSHQEFAAKEAVRYIDLGRKGFASQSLVDAKVEQLKSADAKLSAAEGGVTNAQKDLIRLKADYEGAKQQRANIRLEAPVSGMVTARDAEPGSTVIAGQSVLKLEDPTSLWIKVRLDQGRSAGLKPGLPAQITLRSDPRNTLAGKVVRVEPISDSVTEERLAEIALDRLPKGLSAGEMAEVTLKLPAVQNVLIVPNASLHYRGVQAGVWQRQDGHLRFAPVETGAEGLNGKVQILKGLRVGDEVIVFSERELKNNSRIKVVSSLGGKTK